MKRYGHYKSSIVWFKRGSPSPCHNNYPNIYSVILYFTKGKSVYFDSSERISFELKTKGEVSDHSVYDVWLDISKIVYGFLGQDEAILNSDGKPILPNQLPTKLLERIIKVSCPENGWVCDPFCGTGTTARASKILNRNFIGGDIDPFLVQIALQSLEKVSYIQPLEKAFSVEEYFGGQQT